jgi:hypothetical protein
VLDPFDVHRTTRRALSAAERPAFDADRAKLSHALGTEVVASSGTSGTGSGASH